MTIKAILFDADGTLVDNRPHARPAATPSQSSPFPHATRNRAGPDRPRAVRSCEALAIGNSSKGMARPLRRRALVLPGYLRRPRQVLADVPALFRRAERAGWTIVTAMSGESGEGGRHLERFEVRNLADAGTQRTMPSARSSVPTFP